jgi:hypothetical protein
MKFYKKSMAGWDWVITVLVLLAIALVFAFIIWQSKGPMTSYLDKIFS